MYQNQQGQGTEPENNQNAYNQNSYGQDGYRQDGYSQNGYSQNGYSQDGYGQSGYGQGAYSQNNYQQGSYAQDGYQQNGYSRNSYNPYNGNYQAPYGQQIDLEEPVKMSEWLISFLILIVPCVNIIMMFVWAFSKTEKKSKSNFFKAYLIMFGVLIGFYFILVMLIVALGLSEIWY